MTVEELTELDKEISEKLKRVPNFYTRYIERSPLLHKYNTANEVFAYCTYTLHRQKCMLSYTSYQFNALALRYYELQEATQIKRQFKKMIRCSNNEQKSVNEIYNKCKTEVEALKKELKLNQLQTIEITK